MQVGAGIGADLGDGKGLAVLVQVHRAGGVGERRDIGIEQLGKGHPAVVRADGHGGDVLEVEVLAWLLAMQADAVELLGQALGGDTVGSIRVPAALNGAARDCAGSCT